MTSSNQTNLTSQQQAKQPEGASTETLFPEQKRVESCTYNECTAGHKFPVQIGITPCPRCRQPILAIKMVNCPTCNEPVKRTAIRTDHMPQGGQITGACVGDASLAEIGQIELLRNHAEDAQTEYQEREMIGKV